MRDRPATIKGPKVSVSRSAAPSVRHQGDSVITQQLEPGMGCSPGTQRGSAGLRGQVSREGETRPCPRGGGGQRDPLQGPGRLNCSHLPHTS